jgi:hypothetical protein
VLFALIALVDAAGSDGGRHVGGSDGGRCVDCCGGIAHELIGGKTFQGSAHSLSQRTQARLYV